ncbi:MAG: POTRA domain-containing protein, partial [Saprospiraceae bacterium]|nr:POTRA domain-containing protein [Saprospiraceae bacterium]
FLNIYLEERNRLLRYSYSGVKKTAHDDLNDVVKPFLIRGQIVTEDIKLNSRRALEKYYKEKGYLDVEVNVIERSNDSLANGTVLTFDIDPKERVKIAEISFVGNDNVKDKKLRKLMSNTKRKGRVFTRSKLVNSEYEADKRSVVDYYNTIGYRDMQVVSDSIWRNAEGELELRVTVDEGTRYYFRDIRWKGNSIHSDDRLSQVLGIRKGDIYNDELLESRLRFSIDGRDVSSLYLDDGYLFFDVEAVEVAVEDDSIDLEMRIFEGPQATIDKVIIQGNDRTHEHVIRREIRTKPGQKFSRSDIIRSQRQIINLGYFNPETLGIDTQVDAARGTVDVIYTVEER